MNLDVNFEERTSTLNADFAENKSNFNFGLDETTAFATSVLEKVKADNDETEAAIGAMVEEVKSLDTANAFKATASGEIVRVNDVSPIEHKVKAKVKSKNLFNAYDCTVSRLIKANNGIFISSIEDYYYSTIYVPKTIVEKFFYCGNTLTFSAPETPNEGKVAIVIFGTRTNGETYQEVTSDLGEKSISIAVADDFTTITRVELRVNRRSSPFTDTETVYTQIQLEEGDTATEYEPYIDPETVKLIRCGKNICDISNVPFVTVNAEGAKRAGIILDKPATYTFSCTASSDTSLAYKVVTNGEYGDYHTLSGRINFTVSIGENQKLIIYKGAEDAFAYGLTNAQLELGDTATDFEPYTAETYTPNADGTVVIASISPCMTLLTNTEGVNIALEYNQDSNAFKDNVKADIQELDKVTAALAVEMGDVETALDSIIAIQNSLIGGDSL